jgi:hypothetical protein
MPGRTAVALVALAALAGGCAGESGATAATAHAGACRWRAVASPSVKGAPQSSLARMSAPSARAAWAIGGFSSGQESGPYGPIVERWDGRRWRLLPDAAPRGAVLYDVSADSPRDAWIVGSVGDNDEPFVQRWDGVDWRRVPLPSRLRGNPFAVDARTPRDVWVTGNRSDGRTLILHWEGRRLRSLPGFRPPQPPGARVFASLDSVDARSASDAWAVGEVGAPGPTSESHTLVMHWDGRRWMRVPSPNALNAAGAAYNWLFAVDAVASHDVWAGGSWNSIEAAVGGGGDHALVERWDGARWRVVPAADVPGRDALYGIAADRRSVWAVGDRGEPFRMVIATRDRGWRLARTRPGSLADIIRAPDGRLWAVGLRGDGRTLVLTCRPD